MSDILPVPPSDDNQQQALPEVPSSSTRDLAASFVEGVNSVDGTLLDMYKRHYYSENDPGKIVPQDMLPVDLREKYKNGLGQNVLDEINAEKQQQDALNSAHVNASQSLLEKGGRLGAGLLAMFSSPSSIVMGGVIGKTGALGVKGLASMKAIREGLETGTKASENLIGEKATQAAKNFTAGVGHGASFMMATNELDQSNQRALGEDTTNESILSGTLWPSLIGGAIHVGVGYIQGADSVHEGILHGAVKDMMQNGDKVDVKNYVDSAFYSSATDQINEAAKNGVDLRQAMSAQADILSRAEKDANKTPYTPHETKLSPIDNPNLVESLDHTLNDLEIHPTEWSDKTLNETDAFKDTPHLYEILDAMMTDPIERTDAQRDLIERGSKDADFEKNLLKEHIKKESNNAKELVERLSNISEDEAANSGYVNDLSNKIEENKKSLNALFRRRTILKAADLNDDIDNLREKINDKDIDPERKSEISKDIDKKIKARDKLQAQKYEYKLPDLSKLRYMDERPQDAFKEYHAYQMLKRLNKNTEIANKILNGKAPNPNELYSEAEARLKGSRMGDVGPEHAVQMDMLVREAETDVHPLELEKQAQNLVDAGKLPQEYFDEVKKETEEIANEHEDAMENIKKTLQCILGNS